MGEVCLFCEKEEKYNRNPNSEYVCSMCVQKFLQIGKEEAKILNDECVKKGYFGKVAAIKMIYGFR